MSKFKYGQAISKPKPSPLALDTGMSEFCPKFIVVVGTTGEIFKVVNFDYDIAH